MDHSRAARRHTKIPLEHRLTNMLANCKLLARVAGPPWLLLVRLLAGSVVCMRLAGSECGVRSSVQVLGVTSRGRLPQASVTLMGSGYMEWSRERDRVINVSAGLPFFPRSTYADCIYDARCPRNAHVIHCADTRKRILPRHDWVVPCLPQWPQVGQMWVLPHCKQKHCEQKISTDAVGGSRQGGGWT